jgi:hypothetical protein
MAAAIVSSSRPLRVGRKNSALGALGGVVVSASCRKSDAAAVNALRTSSGIIITNFLVRFFGHFVACGAVRIQVCEHVSTAQSWERLAIWREPAPTALNAPAALLIVGAVQVHITILGESADTHGVLRAM